MAANPTSQVPTHSAVQNEHIPEHGVTFPLRIFVSLKADSFLGLKDIAHPPLSA